MKTLTKKVKEIKETIAVELGKRLGKDGFAYRKSNNQFECKKGDNTFIFNMLVSSWNDHYSITVRLYISNRKIEEVFETILSQSHKLTMGNTIQRIYKSPDGRQVVNGDMSILIIFDADLESAIESLESYYADIAKPYYEKYQTLTAIDDIINNPPFNYCPAHVGGNFDERCMRGLIVARLTNNPNYETLISTYDEAIKETLNQESIENYNKVKEYLMYHRI